MLKRLFLKLWRAGWGLLGRLGTSRCADCGVNVEPEYMNRPGPETLCQACFSGRPTTGGSRHGMDQ